MNSSFKTTRQDLKHLPPAPKPSLLLTKISHSSPMLVHLFLSSVYVVMSSVLAAISHIIDGGIKKSWNFATSVCHASMKAFLTMHAPSGRHSLDICRFFLSFKFPDFIFGSQVYFTEASIEIDGCENLHKSVIKALNVPPLHYDPIPKESRTISGEWILPSSMNDLSEIGDTPILLYLHGGAHIFCSPNTHRVITSGIAKQGIPVFALDYRLAPEHPFPSGLEDSLAAYLALLQNPTTTFSCKFSSSALSLPPIASNQVFIAGDSSGACLTLQLINLLAKLNLPMPGGSVLLSPFLDMELNSHSWHQNWNSDFLSLDGVGVTWAMDIYRNGVSQTHPCISPLDAPLEEGVVPPMLIQAGDSEVVTSDAFRLYQKATLAGVRVEFQIFQDMFHVFQSMFFTLDLITYL